MEATQELEHQIRESSTPDVLENDAFHVPPLAAHLTALLRDHNMTVQDVILRCNLDRSYAYQMFNGTAVMNNGLLDVERHIMGRQSLKGEFDLLTSASNSTKAMRELITAVHEQMKEPSDQRYYGLSRDFGYGITTGWLQVLVQDGRIVRCLYDKVFADHSDDIWYPELKAYFKQSKYYSPNFEEPFPPDWSKNGWQVGFTDLMEMLSQQVVNNQDPLDLTGLPHVEGENLGLLWNWKEPYDEPDYNILSGTSIPRYPVWDNYLALSRPMLEVLTQDRWTPGCPADS